MKTYIKCGVALLLCLISGVALADVVMPESLHRIGYEVLVYATGAAAALGGGLLAGSRKRNVRAVAESVTEWKADDSVTAEERSDIEEKLEAGLPALRKLFETDYVVRGKEWLKDTQCPLDGERNMWWEAKCEELVSTILLQNEDIRQQLMGVPIEWVLRQMKLAWYDPMRTRKEWLVWIGKVAMRKLRSFLHSPLNELYDLVGRFWFPESRIKHVGYLEAALVKIQRHKKGRKVVWFCGPILFAYLLELLALKFGVVDVCSSDGWVWLLKLIFYPLVIVAIFWCLVFVLRITWEIADMFVIAPARELYDAWNLKRIVTMRERLFIAYRGERKWKIQMSPIEQMKDGEVVGVVGNASGADLALAFKGVARCHAEIIFDKTSVTFGGSWCKMRSLRWNRIGEHVDGRLPKYEKSISLNAKSEICVGPYAVLKVVSVPSEKDNAFVFELVDGKRQDEKAAKTSQPDTSTGRLEPSENTVPFVCDDVHKRTPLVVGEHGGIVFGRSHRSDVRLYKQDFSVSGRHLEIIRDSDQFFAVCLSGMGMTVNDERIEHSERSSLHEGDCIRIGKNTEVRVVRLPKNGDDVMVLNVKDGRGTREEEVRWPMVGEDTPREEECLSRPCHDNAGLRDGDTAVCCDDGFPAPDGGGMMCTKPVIYLYPQSLIKCSVCVRFNGKLICTYPAHGTDGWRDFFAAPDGTLTFPDAQKFYCLYWEGTTPTRWDFSQGYCVKGADTATFLADILTKMGLSFRETNEFIIYWLPRMQDNPYNVIAFQNEIYTQSAKLEIEPKPDSILRVFMAWKASDQPVDIPAPDVKPFKRKGFTVVEWGGTEVGK